MKKALLSNILFILFGGLFNVKGQSSEISNKEDMKSIYGISINGLMGEKIDLSTFRGKKILFVNVASKCGFTPQYKALQKLHEDYGEKIVVIGLPCNQFGGQEPGNADEIQQFCSENYGVSFLLTQKLEVKGPNQHPIYKWLTDKNQNSVKSTSVKWNFQKYLIDEEGKFIDVFYSITKPLSDKITKHLN